MNIPHHVTQQEILVFFYGSYINLTVLKEVNYSPRKFEVARLPGYTITIRPLANITVSADDVVYGILATGTHQELERLYNHAETILGGKYLPRAVLVQKLTGDWIPAMTYISLTLIDRQPKDEYVDRIAVPAEELKFPAWYIEKLKSFKSQ